MFVVPLGLKKAVLVSLRIFSLKRSTVGAFAVPFYGIEPEKQQQQQQQQQVSMLEMISLLLSYLSFHVQLLIMKLFGLKYKIVMATILFVVSSIDTLMII